MANYNHPNPIYALYVLQSLYAVSALMHAYGTLDLFLFFFFYARNVDGYVCYFILCYDINFSYFHTCLIHVKTYSRLLF